MTLNIQIDLKLLPKGDTWGSIQHQSDTAGFRNFGGIHNNQNYSNYLLEM